MKKINIAAMEAVALNLREHAVRPYHSEPWGDWNSFTQMNVICAAQSCDDGSARPPQWGDCDGRYADL